MLFKFKLGVDISKNWFNYALMNPMGEIILEGEIDNQPESIEDFIEKIKCHQNQKNLDSILLILEYTGIYVQPLVRAWLAHAGKASLVHAGNVSEQLGGVQYWTEKTDPLDARRLAEYGMRFEDKLKLWEAPKLILEKLQAYQRQRTRIQCALNLLKVPANEMKEFIDVKITKQVNKNQNGSIKALKKDLKAINTLIDKLLQSDVELKRLFKLITSVEGVGKVTATEIIITTKAFTEFSPEDVKKYSRYSGVVPLQKQSGLIRKRSRTSKKANRKIKTLLTMGATSLIGTNSELGQYYKRKIEEGKKHFVVINAMRNKILLRVFAVVRNQTMYQKNLNICLE